MQRLDFLVVLPVLAIGALCIALVRQRRANAELRRQIAVDRLRWLAGDAPSRP